MQTRPLGTSDLQITPLGLGTWAIGGGGWDFAWGPQDDRESLAAIEHALDLGINWIDTAPIYGLGHSEEVVGQAISGRSTRPYIFTKCTRRWDNQRNLYGSLKADSIRQEVEDSLRRLKIDVIDLYQIHWPDPDPDIEESWTTLAELKEEGKVRALGASNFSVEQMKRAQAIAPIASLQPPYSMIRRDIEAEILPFCQQHNIGVISYSPMQLGLLSGTMTRARIANFPPDDHRRNRPEFQEPALSRNLELVERLRQIGDTYGRSPAEVAIAWCLRHPAITAVIVGVRRPSQADGIIGAGEFRLSQGEIDTIEDLLRG